MRWQIANEAHSTELAITFSYPTSASEIIGVQQHSKKCLKIGYNLCFFFNNAQFDTMISKSLSRKQAKLRNISLVTFIINSIILSWGRNWGGLYPAVYTPADYLNSRTRYENSRGESIKTNNEGVIFRSFLFLG